MGKKDEVDACMEVDAVNGSGWVSKGFGEASFDGGRGWGVEAVPVLVVFLGLVRVEMPIAATGGVVFVFVTATSILQWKLSQPMAPQSKTAGMV